MAQKKVKMDKSITESTLFVAPTKTLIVNGEWLCQCVPCYIISKTDDEVVIKAFNKARECKVTNEMFTTHFITLNRDSEYVYADSYPNGRIAIVEFTINPISIAELSNHFKENTEFVGLLDKAYQDSYVGKGNTFCINMKKYADYESNKQISKLERIGDPIFNRTSRHTVPIQGTFSRDDFENCASFPAPIGIRAEDFALPSEQNDILREMLTQIFNCVGAPDCPPDLQAKLGIQITSNSHMCEWCGERMDISSLNQQYCSKEHSVNFCHRDPVVGTKRGNVYIGHCSCNREQGGYSEEQRVMQIIRLAKYNENYRKLILESLA
jgi:hypothetical protein